MDEVDVGVLRWLMTGPEVYGVRSDLREPMKNASAMLHVPESTVRSRTERLFRSGLLRGSQPFVNPHLVGKRVSFVELDVRPPSTKQEAIERIRLMDDVWLILDYHGDAISVGTYFVDDESWKRKTGLMSKIANSESAFALEVLFPPSSYEFKERDLKIIACIQDAPDLTFTSMAEKLGMSSKTIRRRLDAMVKEKAIFTVLDFDLGKAKGFFFAQFVVQFEGEESAAAGRDEVMSRFGRWIFAGGGDARRIGFTAIIDNISEAGHIVDEVKSMRGVENAFFHMVEQYLGQFHVFREQVQALKKAG